MDAAKRSTQTPNQQAGSAARTGKSKPRTSPASDHLPEDGSPPLKQLAAFWPGVVFQQRPDFTFAFVTSQMEELTGVPVAHWHTSPVRFWDVVHEQDAERLGRQIQECAQAPGFVTLEYRLRNLQTGRVHYLTERRRALRNAAGELVGYEGLWLDCTRQKLAERRMAAANWNETLAVVTMGLAHDFNNIFAGICSLSDTYLCQVDASHPFHEGLTLINQKANEASQLVNRLANVHRDKTGSRSYHDLNEVVRNAVELLRRVFPRQVEFTTQLSETALPLYVDAVAFQRVIINLVLNAVEAMTERGELRFETSQQATLDRPEHAVGIVPRMPGCCLTIADTGKGIPIRHLDSIFDSYFTTKSVNHGCGLGLSNAKRFVENHQGLIAVESNEGAGTTFRLWLPQADFTEAEPGEASLPHRRRSFLLVGPPGPPLDVMAALLRQHQVQVFTTTDHAEDWFQSGEYCFDGLILQIEAQDLQAPSLVSFVRQHTPNLKVILQILGGQQEPMETQFLFRADLILTPDLTAEAIWTKLEELFNPQSDSDS